ncbi:hypothetical protein D3C71_1221110 [compost metagenome]
MGRPARTGRGQPLVHRAHGCIGRAAVCRARQPAGTTLVHRGGQRGVGADRRVLRPDDSAARLGCGRRGSPGHRRHVQPALPASPRRRGGLDRGAGRAVRSQPGLWLRAVAGGPEFLDPAVHCRGLQRRPETQLPPPPCRPGTGTSHPRRRAQHPPGLQPGRPGRCPGATRRAPGHQQGRPGRHRAGRRTARQRAPFW